MKKDFLNMGNSIVEYESMRLELGLPPRPTYPCKDFEEIVDNSPIVDGREDSPNRAMQMLEMEAYTKKAWEHFDNCGACDFGYWKTYKNGR